MKTWIYQHLFAQRQSRRWFWGSPLRELVRLLVFGMLLAAFTGMSLLADDFVLPPDEVTWLEPTIVVFMKPGASEQEVRGVWDTLAARVEVRTFRYVSRDDALKELQAVPGLRGALENLKENPLPATFVIRARDTTPGGLTALKRFLEAQKQVDRVQMDETWAKRRQAFLNGLRVSTKDVWTFLGALLVVLLFDNTASLWQREHEEALVAHSLGATPRQVRRPFLYHALGQGFLGGAVAGGLLWWGIHVLNDMMPTVNTLFHLSWDVPVPSVRGVAALILVSGLANVLAGRLALIYFQWRQAPE